MPVLTARGAGVRQHQRWLFRDLDVTVEPGELVALVGPPGSGRTTLLLSLAKRFRLTSGQVTVDGRAALGYVPTVTEPEAVFTVLEHVHEQLALFGRRHREAAGVDLRGLEPHAKGRDLSPYEKQVLGLVLALLERPALIALDGLDESLDDSEQAALMSQLTELAAGGTTVLFTARRANPTEVTTVIDLTGPTTDPKPATPIARPGPALPTEAALPAGSGLPAEAGRPAESDDMDELVALDELDDPAGPDDLEDLAALDGADLAEPVEKGDAHEGER
jgi:ABC-type Mn2+/Zn2+ transport system ATPase subunit